MPPAPSRLPVVADDTDRDRLVRLVRRGWWLALLGALLGAVLAGLLAGSRPERLSSTIQVLVRPITADPLSPGRPDQLVSVDTEALVVRSDAVLEAARAEITPQPETIQALRRDLEVTAAPGSQVLRITYTAADAARARQGAQAVADAYLLQRADGAKALIAGERVQLVEQVTVATRRFAELSAQIASLPADDPQRVVLQTSLSAAAQEAAALQQRINTLDRVRVDAGSVITPPSRPRGSGIPLAAAVLGGALAGFTLGLGIAVLLQARAERHPLLRLARACDAPTIRIPPAVEPAAVLDPAGLAAEAYREVVFALDPAPGSVLALTALRPASASSAAANIAWLLAAGDAPTLLVTSTPGGPLGIPSSVPLPEPGAAAEPTPTATRPSLRVLPLALAEEGLSTVALEAAIAEAAARGERVVVDLPPVASLPSARGVLRRAAQLAVVVRPNPSGRDIDRVIDTLALVGVPVGAVVVDGGGRPAPA